MRLGRFSVRTVGVVSIFSAEDREGVTEGVTEGFLDDPDPEPALFFL